jgi:hypothetical protein
VLLKRVFVNYFLEEQIVGSIVTVYSIIVRLPKPLVYLDLVPAIPRLLVDAMAEKLAILPRNKAWLQTLWMLDPAV